MMLHVARVLIVAAMFVMPGRAEPGAQDAVDFSDRTVPTCDLAGVVARPADGWFAVPFETPPPGHLGCQMLRTNEAGELSGILRVRSATAPAEEFSEEDRLLANEVAAVARMGIALDQTPLWVRTDVPVTGTGFREGRAVGLAARIEASGLAQEVHFLVFRSDTARYVFTLITPASSADAALHERNTTDFGTVIRTLQPAVP